MEHFEKVSSFLEKGLKGPETPLSLLGVER
jgi:hypothetical protein